MPKDTSAAEIHIPLVHGQQEGIDPKMLPEGWLTEARNVRLRKDNRFGSRFGYAYLSGIGTPGAAVAAGNIGPKHSVYFAERASASTPAKWYDRGANGNFTTPAIASSAGTLGVPRRVALVRNPKWGVMSSDMVQAGAYIFCVYADSDYATGAQAGASLLVYEATTYRLVQRTVLQTQDASNVKIVAVGAVVMAFYAQTITDQVSVVMVNSSTLAVTSTIVALTHANRAFSFDVAPYDSTKCLMAYESDAVTLKWGTVSAVGTYTNVVNTTIANPARPTICKISGAGTNVVLAWAEDAQFYAGNLYYKIDDIGGSAVLAKQTRDNGGVVVGFPVVGPNATDGFSLAWNHARDVTVWTYGRVAVANVGWVTIASKPFVGPNNACLFWTVSQSFAIGGDAGTYKLLDIESPHDLPMGGAICEAVSCQLAALNGAYQLIHAGIPETLVDNRRSGASITTVSDRSSATAIGCLLPVFTDTSIGADMVRIDSGPYEDRLLPVNINGQLLFSGPRVREFDGSTLFESGFAQGPEYVSLTDAGAGGSLSGGDYQYILVYRWYDAQGRVHRSPPSKAQTLTTTVSHKTTVTYSKPSFSDRCGGNSVNCGITTEIYRTLVDGTVFYLLNVDESLPIGTLDATLLTYTDNNPDSAIDTDRVLYTQGERGGISGLLPNDEAPPCRFMCAGADRVLAGGLEDPTAYQFSRPIFPGEPVQWSIESSFRGNVDEELTGAGQLDGSWFIFTTKSIWVVNGAGPDDSNQGSFSVPVKLPSDSGCINHRSLVDAPQGLFFQGIGGKMYLLPRGGNTPVWVGQAVRDTLASVFIVAGKLLPEENCIAWACNGSGGAFSLVVYDTRAGEWMVDSDTGGVWTSNRSTVDVYDGKLILDGSIAETDAFVDDVDGSHALSFTTSLTLGDIRPFGPMGHGRIRRAVILGESRTASSVDVQLSISYDSGVSFSDASDVWPVTSAAGTRVRKDHLLKYVRNESVRPKLTARPTSTSAGVEGFVFNDLSLEIFPATGTPRLAAGDRG